MVIIVENQNYHHLIIEDKEALYGAVMIRIYWHYQ